MTNLREASEKIADDYGINPNWGRDESLRWLESILQSVGEEAILDDRMKRTADDLYQLSRSAGRAEGLECAAKIAESVYGTQFHDKTERRTGRKIAANIRGLKA